MSLLLPGEAQAFNDYADPTFLRIEGSTDVVVCDRCGSLVAEIRATRHIEWHRATVAAIKDVRNRTLPKVMVENEWP